MIAKVNGVELYYEKTGSGRPLLLLHGNGEDHTIFYEALKLLRKEYTCYALDTRGHGRSTRVKTLHYDDMAADVLAFLEALDLREVFCFGFSDGGITALLAASRTDRITTLAAAGANLTPAGVVLRLRLAFRAAYAFTRDDKLALMLHEPQISPEMLGRIRARTLVLAGSRDLIREQETRRIAAAIPGAKLCILSGEDHGSYIVHSEKIARLLLDFGR